MGLNVVDDVQFVKIVTYNMLKENSQLLASYGLAIQGLGSFKSYCLLFMNIGSGAYLLLFG